MYLYMFTSEISALLYIFVFQHRYCHRHCFSCANTHSLQTKLSNNSLKNNRRKKCEPKDKTEATKVLVDGGVW